MKKFNGATAILFWREFTRVLFSPAAVSSALFFLFGTGIPFFAFGSRLSESAYGLRHYVSVIPYVSCIVIPALTMGVWSNERKAGTDRLLLGMPVGEGAIIASKFFAILAVYGVLLLLTLPVVLLAPVARDAARYILPGYGSAVAAYAVLLSSGAAMIAIGILFSVITGRAIPSFLGSAAALFACTGLTFQRHFESASRGMLDSRDLAFYLVPCAAALYLSRIVLYFRRKYP